MITRKKLTAIASAFALSGTLAIAAPTAYAEEEGNSSVAAEGSPGSSEGENGEGDDSGSSTGDDQGGDNGEGDGSSFDSFKDDLSSEDYKEENGTSSEAQKWVLGLGIVGAILAFGSTLLPQLQQFMPKM